MLLVLDDRQDMCKAMRRMMRILRIPGDCFQQWTEARKAVESAPEKYDHALIDLALSDGESGMDAIHWLRQQHPHIHCILMSGSRNVPPQESPFSYHNFLPKPFGMDELVSAIS